MTISVPARILPPVRGQVVRRMSSDDSSVSVTFTVEKSGGDGKRAFPFAKARHGPDASDVDARNVLQEGVPAERESRARGFAAMPWMGHAGGSSSGFLAGMIAQESPGIRLYNPQHQAAARVYRTAHSLGLGSAPPHRHSTSI